MVEYVTSDMLIGDIISQYPPAVYALMQCGMGCVSCPSAQMESLAEASMVHGLDSNDVVNYLNAVLNELNGNNDQAEEVETVEAQA